MMGLGGWGKAGVLFRDGGTLQWPLVREAFDLTGEPEKRFEWLTDEV